MGMTFSLSLQIVFLVQIYYALLGLAQPRIRKVFIVVIMSVGIMAGFDLVQRGFVFPDFPESLL